LIDSGETHHEVTTRCAARAQLRAIVRAWTRGGLAKREKAQVEAHLDTCERCRALAAELADVNGAMYNDYERP
jgi:anti-sigma factor RsiW